MPIEDVLAIILGGGRGTRLYPLTKQRAKPAVPLGGKYRLIDIPISNCLNSGITRICVLTQFLSASLHRHVYETYKFDAFSKRFVELLPAEQTLTSMDWYEGSADAVRRQMHRFVSRNPEDVLILAGDHLYRMDYEEFVTFHRERRADVTIAVFPIPADETSRYGIVRANDEGHIITFREKPRGMEALRGLETPHRPERPYMASMGIYVFRMDVLTRLLDTNPGTDFGNNIIPDTIARERVYAFPFNGYWEDIGTISSFYEANLALTKPKPPFDFHDHKRPIYTRSRFLPPSRIEGCRLRRAVVADGTLLAGAEIEECIIGLRSVVQPGSRLHKVVMMGADYYEDDEEVPADHREGVPHLGIGEGTVVERAIIDKNARIGREVIIRSQEGMPDREGEHFAVRDGIVIVTKNAVIPDGTVI